MNNPINIAYIIDGLGMGGAERLMIPILKHLDRKRFNPRICALQSKGDNPLAEDIRALGAPVDELTIPYLRDLNAIPRLRNYLHEHGIALVHTQLEFSNILGNIAAKSLRLPSVCTVHVLPSDGARARSKLHQQAEWLALKYFCDRVLTVSEDTRQSYIARSGIPARKLTALHNGIDFSPYLCLDSSLVRASVRDEFRIPQDAHLIVTVAVLRPPKGIDRMLQAMPAVLEALPNTYYLIVGDGAHRQELENETKRLNLTGIVLFAGMRKDIPRLLVASDLFVLPTLTEALPTVLAEAMAARLPIIASAVGGIPEMVTDGDNGFLVPPSQPSELSRACLAVLSSEPTRRRMSENGWQVVNQKFKIENQVRQLEQIYLNEMNQHGK
jgi:glycosyltransferase involved in cell wall biosynthesis